CIRDFHVTGVQTCALPISLMFAGLYILLYMVPPGVSWWGEIGGQWWYRNGPVRTAPTFIAFAFLIAGLVAMTVIDARTFTIPIRSEERRVGKEERQRGYPD